MSTFCRGTQKVSIELVNFCLANFQNQFRWTYTFFFCGPIIFYYPVHFGLPSPSEQGMFFWQMQLGGGSNPQNTNIMKKSPRLQSEVKSSLSLIPPRIRIVFFLEVWYRRLSERGVTRTTIGWDQDIDSACVLMSCNLGLDVFFVGDGIRFRYSFSTFRIDCLFAKGLLSMKLAVG